MKKRSQAVVKAKPADKAKADPKKLLAPHRIAIDAIDDDIMKLLKKRFDVVRKVAHIKAENDFPSYISDRVVQVRERNAATGLKYGIDPDFVRMLYSLVIYQSCAEEDIIKYSMKSKAKKKG